jgi:hypothetical protein
MTSEEIQRKLDELEQKRNDMKAAQLQHAQSADTVLFTIRESISSMQKTVEEIMEPSHVKRNTRNIARA